MRSKVLSFIMVSVLCFALFSGCNVDAENERESNVIYAGDTATEFNGNTKVIYKDGVFADMNDGWKDFETDEADVIIQRCVSSWYMGHIEGYYVRKTKVTGNSAKQILYELSLLEETGEAVPEVTNINGDALEDTVWIKTPSKCYRIPGDKQEIHLVEDYHSAGKALSYNESLAKLVRYAQWSFPQDTFSASYDKDNDRFVIQKKYDGDCDDIFIIKDVIMNGDDIEAIKADFTAASGGTFKAMISAQAEGCIVYSDTSEIEFTAEAGKTVEITIPFPVSGASNYTVTCSDICYDFYTWAYGL